MAAFGTTLSNNQPLREENQLPKECKSPQFSMLGDLKSPFPRLPSTSNLGLFKKEEEKPKQYNIVTNYYFINNIGGTEGFKPQNP
mmetsp:Transcript_33570/g.51633  ORF Transcript_33570/g.51633 Transcript_33570/m.51633 type:complete len:85 (+) Transcript_33570:1631-1885(+)